MLARQRVGRPDAVARGRHEAEAAVIGRVAKHQHAIDPVGRQAFQPATHQRRADALPLVRRVDGEGREQHGGGDVAFAERGAVTNEYLRAFKELWTSDNPTFQGKYCQFSDLKFLPKPVQKPHPPIWVGGQSRRALRRAAQLGNGWHPVGAIPAVPLEPEELAQNLALLHRYADEAGRDPGQLDVSMKTPLYDSAPASSGPRRRFSGDTDQILQDVQTYADVGVTHLIFDIRGTSLDHALERLEWFATDVMANAS